MESVWQCRPQRADRADVTPRPTGGSGEGAWGGQPSFPLRAGSSGRNTDTDAQEGYGAL